MSLILNNLAKINFKATLTPLVKNAVAATKTPWMTPCRTLVLHEHHNMEILRDAGVTVPPFRVANTPVEAELAASELGPAVMVKAQVLAGGRGKGTFDSGLIGGVQKANSGEEARQLSQAMIGHRLTTRQTAGDGLLCQKVMVSRRIKREREFYFAITNESDYNGPVIMISTQGGMEIEEVAHKSPEAILKYPIDIKQGLTPATVQNIVDALGFPQESREKAVNTINNLYQTFLKNDVLMLEINPLCYDASGDVYCLDAKLRIDDNANYRHSDLFAKQDWTQKDAREKLAFDNKLNFIPLTGQIGCLVNGAGLAMATMDLIKLQGGVPANFLDLGGGAGPDQITQAFLLVAQDPGVRVILVNIFGGILRCDLIVEGIQNALNSMDLQTPTICRLQGSRVDEAKKLLAKSRHKILACDTMEEATRKAVELCNQVMATRSTSSLP